MLAKCNFNQPCLFFNFSKYFAPIFRLHDVGAHIDLSKQCDFHVCAFYSFFSLFFFDGVVMFGVNTPKNGWKITISACLSNFHNLFSLSLLLLYPIFCWPYFTQDPVKNKYQPLPADNFELTE